MELQRYLRYLIYSGLFIIPFVGIIVWTPFFFPFITGKNFLFRILVEFIFGLWVILSIWNPSYRPRFTWTTVLGGLLMLTMAVSTVLAENPSKAFWSNFERMEGYITLIHLAMYVLVMTTMLKTQEMWSKMFSASIIASCVVALYGIVQVGGYLTINQGGVRVDATLGNATYFAVYMMFNAFLCLYLLATWAKSTWLRIELALVAAVQMALVVFSATRGTILGLAGGLFLSGLIIAVMGKGLHRKIGIAVVGAVIVIALGFIAVKDTAYVQAHPILSRIATISIDAGSTRYQIWSMALKGAAERPIFGWGQDGFNYLFNKYYYAELYAQEPWFDRAHSVALDWLVAGGILGALLYLSLYATILWYLWRPGNTFSVDERALLTGLLAAYAFHNIFVFDNLMSYVMFMMLLAYVTVRAVPHTAWGKETEKEVMMYVAPITLTAMIVVMYVFNGAGIASASGLIQGMSPQQGGVAENIRYFNEAAKRTGLGTQEVAEQYAQFAIQMGANQQLPIEVRSKLAEDALIRLQKEIARAPNDARLHLFMGSYLKAFGQNEQAFAAFQKALENTPQKQGIKFEIGSLLLSKGDKQAALLVFKDAYESAPGFEQARSLYALAALENNDTALAATILGDDTPNEEYLYQSLKKNEMWKQVVSILDKRIAQSDAQLVAHTKSGDTNAFTAEEKKNAELKNERSLVFTKLK